MGSRRKVLECMLLFDISFSMDLSKVGLIGRFVDKRFNMINFGRMANGW